MGVRVLSVPRDHPRILLDPARLAVLRQRASTGGARWQALLGQADSTDGDKLAKALVRQVLDDPSYCLGEDGAIAKALEEIGGAGRWAGQAGDVALVYDWCHGELDGAAKDAIVGFFGTVQPDGDDLPGWGNYWPRWGYSYAFMGLAALDDSTAAKAWLDEYRHDRFGDHDVADLDRIAPGGGWPEGTVYDWIANLWRVKAVEGWRSATGENLFLATDWFRQRLPFLLMMSWPGVEDLWGSSWYHPYPSHGDAERNRGPMANYGRIMGEILIGAFPEEPAARQLQAYLAAAPADHPDSFLAHEEFLFFDPAQQAEQPGPTAHLAAGTGDVIFRSGWPSGAADTDPAVTRIELHCGDRFSYHQHYEQGSLNLFSGEPLLLDSGVYSGDGLSNHDVNYYVRTIAHNTLIVYNPEEDFGSSRPDAASNDGGQRSPYPGTRAPLGVAYQEQHAPIYETGDILRFENSEALGYVLTDATAAYNNPAYNQARDSDLPGNVAKVTHFQRELAYLRRSGSWRHEAVVLYDRVGVTDPAFSGENTKLLFHVQNEPWVSGTGTPVSPGETLFQGAGEAVAVAPAGARATLRFLLPQQHAIRRVGGRGIKAFWVFGANYDWQWEESETQPRPINDFEDLPWGEWRLELEPTDTALDHRFLTVIFPDQTGMAENRPAASSQELGGAGLQGDSAATGPGLARGASRPAPPRRIPDRQWGPPARRAMAREAGREALPSTSALVGDGVEGALLTMDGEAQAVLFSSSDTGEPVADRLSYTVAASGPVVHTLLDLPSGSSWTLVLGEENGGWRVLLTRSSGGDLSASSQGVLRFCTRGGGPCDAPRSRRPLGRVLPAGR